MAVRAGWRDERGDFVHQLQRREHQIARAVGAGLAVVIEQMLVIQRVQMLQREGWAGAVAQEPFQPCPVCATDAHREFAATRVSGNAPAAKNQPMR